MDQQQLASMWKSMTTVQKHDLFVTDPVTYKAAKEAHLAPTSKLPANWKSVKWDALSPEQQQAAWREDPAAVNAALAEAKGYKWRPGQSSAPPGPSVEDLKSAREWKSMTTADKHDLYIVDRERYDHLRAAKAKVDGNAGGDGPKEAA